MITLSNLTCPKRRPILKDISLTINTGEITGIIGRPGSGKSALLNIISGTGNRKEVNPRSLIIGDRDIRDYGKKELARILAYYTGEKPENLDEPVFDFLMLSRMSHRNFFRPFSDYDLQVVEQYVASFGLDDLRNARLRDLSEVQIKKTMLAFTFARTPEILLMDNPAAGLDVASVHFLTREIIRSASGGRLTVMAASNDLNFISQIADRIVILEDGKLAEEGGVDLLNAGTIKKYYGVDVFVSRNIYNGRPNIHLFPEN